MKNYDHKSTRYWSQSLLKLFNYSAANVKAAILDKTDPTAAKIEGSVFHALMENNLENIIVFDETKRPVPDKDYKTKVNKIWKDEKIEAAKQAGKILIDVETFENCQKMVEAVKKTELYQNLCRVPFIGAEEFYQTEMFGVGLKCKPDAVYQSEVDPNLLICIDWKSTKEKLTGNPAQLEWIIKKNDFGFQCVHYCELLKNITKKDVLFIFVFVEKEEPYNVAPVSVKEYTARSSEDVKFKRGEIYSEAYIKWMSAIDEAKNFNFDNPETLEQKIIRNSGENKELFIKL